MRYLTPVLACLIVCGCDDGGESSVTIDTSAIEALRIDGAPRWSTSTVAILCDDGRKIERQVPVDRDDDTFTVRVPPCGAARVQFNTRSNDGLLVLLGETTTVLRRGPVFVDLTIRYVGTIALKLAADVDGESCDATLERLTPDTAIAATNVRLTKVDVTTLTLPIGTYRATCDGRTIEAQINPGVAVAVELSDPAIPGPRLLSHTIEPAYTIGVTQINATFLFSVPVFGVDTGITIDKGASIDFVEGGPTTYSVQFSGLNSGTDYVVSLSSTITDANALPLVGAPVTIPFRIGVNEYYVSVAGSDTATGTSFSDPFATISRAVAAAEQPALIRVAAGDYAEVVTMRDNIVLEGGYEDDFSFRDLRSYVSHIRAADQVVRLNGLGRGAVVDGFWIEGTAAQIIVSIASGSPIVRNNVIVSSSSGPTPVGYGVFVDGAGTALVANNIISIRGGTNAARSLHAQSNAAPLFVNNTLDSGGASTDTSIYVEAAAGGTKIVNNLFLGITSAATRLGIVANATPSTVLNNMFASEVTPYYNSAGTAVAIGGGDFGFTTPYRYGGNVATTSNSSAMVSGTYYQPTSPDLNIGIDSWAAECGLVTSPTLCEGPRADRYGTERNSPPSVGASEYSF